MRGFGVSSRVKGRNRTARILEPSKQAVTVGKPDTAPHSTPRGLAESKNSSQKEKKCLAIQFQIEHSTKASPQRTRTNQHAKKNFDRRGAGRSATFISWTADGARKSPKDPFVLLLNGVYQPVVNAPDLGFSKVVVDLNDGSFSMTQIFPVHVEGIPCDANENTPIGTFYVQFVGDLAVYQLPGGAIAMQFIPNCDAVTPSPDGLGGFFFNGTIELRILEATGIFRSFQHGHNHMVDRLHQLDAAGTQFDEYCFCFITRHGDKLVTA